MNTEAEGTPGLEPVLISEVIVLSTLIVGLESVRDPYGKDQKAGASVHWTLTLVECLLTADPIVIIALTKVLLAGVLWRGKP